MTLSYVLLDPHKLIGGVMPPAVTSLSGGAWPMTRDNVIYVAIVTMICSASVRTALAKAMA